MMKTLKEFDILSPDVARKELDECIQIFLQHIIDDLRNSATEGEAGWRKPSQLETTLKQLDELFKSGIMEKNLFGEVRINFRDRNIRRKLSSLRLQFEQIDYFIKNRETIMADMRKLQTAQKILVDLKEMISSHPSILPSIVTIGLWKMLNTSDMSALVDDILKEGFSPKDWAIVSTQSTPYVAISIAQTIGKIESFGEAIKLIEKLGFMEKSFVQPNLGEEQIQKVKRILRWNIIEKCLTEEEVKFLGVSWFMIFLLERKDSLPFYDNFFAQVIDNIKDTIEEMLHVNWDKLSETLENSVSEINKRISEERKQEINLASDIIFMPEMV